MNTHTPTPWVAVERADFIEIQPTDNTFFTVAKVSGASMSEARANAAYIVRCVNEREELVRMLIDAVRKLDKPTILESYGQEWWKRFCYFRSGDL